MEHAKNSDLPIYVRFALDDSRAGEGSPGDAVGRAGGVQECGDVIEMRLDISDGRIQRARYLASGCPGALASAAAAAQLAEGSTLDELARLTEQNVYDLLEDLPDNKRACSNLGALAVKHAVENHVSGGGLASLTIEDNRVAVAMSGGVDSSVAAARLVRDGFDVIGISMRLYDTEATKSCCSAKDLADAAAVADKLQIPHYTVDFRELFKQKVIEPFCREYLAGRTPNPCVDCNRFVKLTALTHLANKLSAAGLATGHYVQIGRDDITGRWLVSKSVDEKKDQSYMFWCASQESLSQMKTPLGNFNKTQVRELAKEFALPVAEKNESQDICFVPDNNYRGFLAKQDFYSPTPGPMVDTSGNLMGQHSGLSNYTVGQRKGLGISGPSRIYVASIDVDSNTLVLGSREDTAARRLIVDQVNWVAWPDLLDTRSVEAVHRYHARPLTAHISPLGENRVMVEYPQPVSGVAPGQSVVFYEGNIVVGGGICESVIKSP